MKSFPQVSLACFLKIYFSKIYFTFICRYVYKGADAHGGQRRTWDPLKLELQEVVS